MSSTGTGSLTGTPSTDSGTNTPTGTPTSTTPTTSPTSNTTPTTKPTSDTTPPNTSKTTPRDTGTPTDNGSSTSQGQSTIFTTTFITTDAGGQTIVTTSMGVTSLPDPNTQSTVAVGPIVGGVLGGVGGILVLGFVAWLMFFRTKKPDRYEDGMFDPDKNIQRPGRAGGGAFDLGTDEIGAARVTPFVLGGTGAGTAAGAGAAAGAGLGAAAARRQSQQPQHPQQPLYPEMRSYNGSDGTSDFFPNPYGNAPPSAYGGVGGANLRRGHTTSSNSSGGYPASLPGSGTGQGGYHTDNTEQYLMSPTTTFSSPSSGPGHHPLPALPPGASGSGPGSGPSAIPGVSAARAAKEREAFSNTRHAQAIANASPNPSVNRFSQHGPLVLTNPSLPSPETETPPPGVVVHRDGGRVREPEPEHQETEIPPTYDSIPSDAR